MDWIRSQRPDARSTFYASSQTPQYERLPIWEPLYLDFVDAENRVLGM